MTGRPTAWYHRIEPWRTPLAVGRWKRSPPRISCVRWLLRRRTTCRTRRATAFRMRRRRRGCAASVLERIPMKLGDKIKATSMVEIELLDSTMIKLNSAGATHELEVIDDGIQQLQLVTTLQTGRYKGTLCRVMIPYSAIKHVTVIGD